MKRSEIPMARRHSWWRYIQAGDVLKWPSGVLRVVRKVSKTPAWCHQQSDDSPRRINCWFTIRHCSWTRRCYTLYSTGELMQIGVRPTGVRIKFKHELDIKINDVIERGTRQIKCCAVKGIA